MEEIRVGVVEDDNEWLYAIVNFLDNEEDITPVWTATNKEDAIQLSKTQKADVILMDINLSDNKCDGIYAAAEICQIQKTKIIMVTSLSEEDIIKNSFIAGAVDFISKSNYREIPNVIRSAYKNTSPFEVLLKDYIHLKEEEQIKELTPAEREIYELLEEGCTQSQIQKKLFKSERTLKNQINKMLKKLGVNSCKEAIKKKKMRGLITKGRQ